MNENAKYLEKENIGQLLLNYSLPAIIATTAGSLYNIIDRIFIGQGVGPYAISGLAITFPIMNLAIAFGTLVGAGAAAIVSIRMGEQRYPDATRTLGNATILNLIIGLLFSIVALIFLDPILIWFGASKHTISYAREFMQVILAGNIVSHMFFGLNNIMRASGYPTKAMISILLTVTINVILAPIFIFWFRWGIRGAALATVLSQVIGMIWVLAHFNSPKSIIHFQKASFKLKKRIVNDIFAIGLSPFLIHICAAFVAVIMNWQLTKYGGDLAIGAFGIINSIAGLIVMVIFGFTQGMQPIVGYNYGAKQMDRVFLTLKLTIFWATGISIIGFLLTLLLPEALSKAFTNDPTLLSITSIGMRLYMLAFPVVGFQIVTSNFFQSIGKAKIAIFLSLSRQLLFLIPFIVYLPTQFNLTGVWIAQPAADIFASLVTGGILFWFYYRLKKRNNLLLDTTTYSS